MDLLIAYDWPGNAQQLQNVIQRLIVLNTDNHISKSDINSALGGDINVNGKASTETPDYFETNIRQAKEQFETEYLRYQLNKVNGNVSALAKNVGLERTHLYRKLKSLKITASDSK